MYLSSTPWPSLFISGCFISYQPLFWSTHASITYINTTAQVISIFPSWGVILFFLSVWPSVCDLTFLCFTGKWELSYCYLRWLHIFCLSSFFFLLVIFSCVYATVKYLMIIIIIMINIYYTIWARRCVSIMP